MAIIEKLIPPVNDADIDSLVELLIDAVDSGAAVSFLATVRREDAEKWWRQTIAALDQRAVLLVARDDRGIVGSVQMHPAWAPNQPHRADIAKLMVHPRSRGLGIGQQLMQRIESMAHDTGFTLLTLDAKRGGAAERLYRRTGWTVAGTIPDYAIDPDGHTPHDTVIFYKQLKQFV